MHSCKAKHILRNRFGAIAVIFVCVGLLFGCSNPLPENQQQFVGLWKSEHTTLLITAAGRLEYQSNRGTIDTSISMPIKHIDDATIEAGFWFINATFALTPAEPTIVNGLTALVVDGETLYLTDDAGRIPVAKVVPDLATLRSIVNDDLVLLAIGISSGDFTSYLANASTVFQSQFTNDRLNVSFAEFIESEVNIAEWMVGDFELIEEPTIDGQGVLTVNGVYPNEPTSLTFSTSHILSNNQWKSLGANVQIE